MSGAAPMSLSAVIDYRALQPHRGYGPAYSAGVACPGCGHHAWLIGRRSAQCGRCGTAIPLSPGTGHV